MQDIIPTLDIFQIKIISRVEFKRHCKAIEIKVLGRCCVGLLICIAASAASIL